MAQVVNIKYRKEGEVWVFDTIRIDRITPWGNPFIIGINGDRDTVCDLYERWLKEWELNGREIKYNIGIREYSNKWVIEHIEELKGKNLACWCSPLRCHGETLVALANKE
jgi:hypothetical protein